MPKEYTLIGGNGTRVSLLEVTESGTYEAGDSRAFNPVKVNVPSGSSTLSGLTDVDISNPSDGQTLVYDAASSKWENGSGGGGGATVTGVYAVDEQTDEETITLTLTAAELFALLSNGPVSIKYTIVFQDSEQTTITAITGSYKTVSDGGSTIDYQYATGGFTTDYLVGSDTVVFIDGK